MQLSRFLSPDDGGKVYASRSEVIVSYRPFAEIERWLKYRFEEKSARKAAYIKFLAVTFFLLGGPIFVVNAVGILLSYMGAGVVNTEVARAAAQSVLGYFYLALAAVAAGSAFVYYSQPTHLCLSDQGVRFLYRRKISRRLQYASSGPLLPWEHVTGIYMVRPKKTAAPNEHCLTFKAGISEPFKVRMGSILTTDERARVLEAIENWAPDVPRDPEVVQALEPPADHSYTELWLKALSAPPKRERLKPLSDGVMLREDRYKIVKALGVGGQGTAYLALDLHCELSEVVLKEFILPVYVDITVRRTALEKFEKEARILKQLDHPQVVRLLDFFIEDHRGYLVLEHIDGKSLRQQVESDGPLPERDVVALARQMCAILEYLHGLSPPVVHRDFTPDNLILRKDGMLKLVDFNVAQQTESTATGTVVGKHAYLPPEQFRGLPTTRSDIYAMGATLYYLLTGEDPEPISVAHPRDVRPEVSTDLDRIIAHATHIDAALRYASACDIEQDLKSFAGHT